MWDFFQTQILAMTWLKSLVQLVLLKCGLRKQSLIFSTLSFFVYDILKITILLCVLIFLISFIQSFFPPEKSKCIMLKFGGLGGRIIGALLGTVTPFCSCSSIPIFIGFTSAGLPLGITFSFLISSPMVDLGSLFLLMSVFGFKVAVLYVLFGLIIAVIGGTIIEKLKMENQIADFILKIRNKNVQALPEVKITLLDRIKSSFTFMLQTLKKVFPYIFIGVTLGAIIHNWIPKEWIEKVLGSKNPFGVILATLFGAPMYADIFGCIPIAESLLEKGALLGVVLSFMMAVTTLSFPSLVMLSKAVKPKLLTIFILICTSGIILIGYAFNFLQSFLV